LFGRFIVHFIKYKNNKSEKGNKNNKV
jgi:hypothetical protein